jgi:hypothetical protein
MGRPETHETLWRAAQVIEVDRRHFLLTSVASALAAPLAAEAQQTGGSFG